MSGVVLQMNTPISDIQGLLALQSKVGRPSAAICDIIAGLKDLCDLHGGGGGQVDWRRGASGPGGAGGRGGANGFRGGGSNHTNNGPAGGHRRPFTAVGNAPTAAGGEGGSPSGVPPPRNGGGSGGGHGPMRYQSRFKNSTQPVEDKILNNIILSKLNKFSGSTYDEIRDFLYQILGSGEPDLAEMIRHFMMLVFKKAAAEEVYCPLYAKLLAEISGRYSVILEEMKKLQANYLEIFDDVEEVPEGGDAYDAFVAKKKEKMYRQGYSQFLAELAGLEILELSNLQMTFEKLFALLLKHAAEEDKKALNEEYADCLVRMARVLKKKSSPFFQTARAMLMKTSKEPLERLITQKAAYPSLSPKARFILMDVKDNLTA